MVNIIKIFNTQIIVMRLLKIHQKYYCKYYCKNFVNIIVKAITKKEGVKLKHNFFLLFYIYCMNSMAHN